MQRQWGSVLGVLTALAVLALAPSHAAAADPVIYVAGDIACEPGSSTSSSQCRERYTSDIIVNGGATRALALGDLQYNSATLSNLQNSYDKTWGRVKSITSPVLGNHESSGGGYFDYFYGSGVSSGPFGARGKGWYSFNLGSWHLIGLNSNCSRVACEAGSEQERWLRADLAANPTTCTLAFWHHPRWSSGHDGDGTFMQPMWQALYDGNVDLALVGHSHHYERFARMNASGALDNTRGIREFIVGVGGAFFTGASNARANSQVRQNNTFGVLKLTLRPTSYDWQFIPEAGKTFTDSGTQACHGSGGTTPPPSDSQAPTVPGTLTATAASPTQVNLSWGASTDNVGVAGYEIYRNGSLLTTKSGTSTTHSDTTVSGGTTYTYEVRALDAAGNRSAFGNSVAVTTPAGGTVRFSPDADTRVSEGSPTTNYGTNNYIRTDGGSGPDVDSYLKFTVSGVSGVVQAAKLRVYAYTGSADGPAVYTTGTSWSESTVNWNSRPAPTSAATDDKTAITANAWVEYDVTPFVTGNGTYSFRLAQGSTDGVDIRSREYTDTALRPELVLTVGGADTQPPSTPSSLIATAVSSSRVDLSWTASSDNVGVTGYEILRNGALLATTTGTGTTFSDTTASASTSYSYQVRARDAAGNRSSLSNTATATTPSNVDTQAPTVPGTLTATPASSTQVNLSWGTSTDNVGVTGYEIYRNGSLLTTKTGTTHSDTTVSAGTTYSYQVRALDAAGNRSAFGNTATVTTPAPDTQPPTVPGTLTAFASSSTQVDLSWGGSTDDTGVTGYELFRNGTLLTTKTSTTHSDTTAAAGTSYTYQVRALDAAGNRSAFGNTAAVTTPNTTTLNLAPDADTRVAEGSPTTTYGTNAYIRTDGGTDPDVDSHLKFTVNGLSGAIQSAKLRVFAYTGSADGPAVYTTGNAWTEAATNWNNRPPPTSAATDDKGAVATNSWIEYNVAPFTTGNGTYSFRLATTSTDGVDVRSREHTDPTQRPELVVTAVAPDTQPPTAPSNLSGTAVSPTQVNLSWSASSDNVGVTGYEVYRDGVLRATTTGTDTTFSDTTASASTSHSYQVRALDAAGNRSAFSNTATVTTPAPVDATPPTAPTNLAGTAVSPTRVDLSWHASTDNVGVTGYDVYRDGALLATTNGTGTGFSDTTAMPSTTHSYQVRARDAANNHSAFSNTATVATPAPPDTQPPTPPSGLTGSAFSPTRVDLSWNASSDNVGVTGYEVFRDGALLGTATGTSFSDTTASPSTSYSYVVRARDAAGNRSGFSNTATVTTPAPPDTQAPTAPSNLTASASSTTQVDLSWTASSDNVGVTGYEIFRDGAYLATATFTSFSDTTASPSTTYSYEVRALDAAGNRSAFSNTAVAITPDPPDTEAPTAPANLTGIVASATQVELSWNASSDNVAVAGYEIFRDGVLLATTSGTGTGYSDATASPSTTHSYKVRALDAAGNLSGFSNTAIVTTPAPPDTEAPTVPANLTAIASRSTQVDLSWTASTDNVEVVAYEVFRDGISLGTASGTAYADVTVSESTTYTYRVRARDAAGNQSALSDAATVTTPRTVQTARFAADADARVEEASPFANFGFDDLGADGGTDPGVESYLRFSVSSVSEPVLSAKLRVFAYSGTVDGPAVYTTTSDWSESGLLSGLNWDNRPGRTSSATDDKGTIAAGSWVEYDVTQLVSGDGTYDFVLATTSEDEVEFYSREQASFAPELVVTY